MRIGNVDRDIIREDVKPLLIRDRHRQNGLAQHMRQRLFGPGKLIDSQIHFKTHITDRCGDRLMSQTERIEGSREKSRFL